PGAPATASTLEDSSSPSSRCRWTAAATISPNRNRDRPVALPSGRLASREPLSRRAHSSNGSWLPPTIGGAGACPAPGAIILAASHWLSAAFGNSHLPVTLVQGTPPFATSSYSLRSDSRR